MNSHFSSSSKTAVSIFVVLCTLAVAGCQTSPSTTGKPTAVAGTQSSAETQDESQSEVTLTPTRAAPRETTTTTMSTATGTMAPSIGMDLDVSSYAVRPGDDIALRATGFQPGEKVQVRYLGSPRVDGDALTADAYGVVQAEAFRIGPTSEGAHGLSLEGMESGRQVSRVISVLGFHPSVALSNYALHPGENSSLRGEGFAPDEQVKVFRDGNRTELASAIATDRGEMQLEGIVNATPSEVGRHSLEAVGQQSGLRLQVSYEVLPYVPVMELNPYAGPPGSAVSFSGRGFTPGETIHATIQENGRNVEIAAFQVNGDGAFDRAGLFVAAPAASNEKITITLEGEQSRVPVSQIFGVLALAPWGGLSDYSGHAETQISFRGKGFAANEPVTIFTGSGDNRQEIATTLTNDSGEFEGGLFTIPARSQGALHFAFHGAQSGGDASADFTVVSQ